MLFAMEQNDEFISHESLKFFYLFLALLYAMIADLKLFVAYDVISAILYDRHVEHRVGYVLNLKPMLNPILLLTWR